MNCCEQVTGADCHCALCHHTFTGLTLFDRHQDVNYQRQPVIICRAPTELGLVQDAGGRWGTPEGLAERARSRVRLASARSARAGHG